MSINKNKEHWTSVSHEYRVRVEEDTDAEDPREWCDISTMVCWHPRYELGDKVPKKPSSDEQILLWKLKDAEPSEFFEILAMSCVGSAYPAALLPASVGKIAADHFFFLPLFLYDHSGITMSTSRGYPFNCPWDSGQVGWIYVSKERAHKEWPGKTDQEILEYLRGEVKTYDQYLTGDVWGFIVERCKITDEEFRDEDDKPWEAVDSCWGFFGEVYEGAYDPEYYVEDDMKQHLLLEQAEIEAIAGRFAAC